MFCNSRIAQVVPLKQRRLSSATASAVMAEKANECGG